MQINSIKVLKIAYVPRSVGYSPIRRDDWLNREVSMGHEFEKNFWSVCINKICLPHFG